MMAKDYYKILGVDKGAKKEDIKKAYKKLAKKFHPDNKETGSEEKFKEINEAAAILGDDQKRQQYDQFGTTDFSGFQGGMGGFDFSEFMRSDMNFDFGDIFDMFFGGGGMRRRRAGPRRGEDLLYDLEISLEEAASGAKKEIIIPRNDTCKKCSGSGAESKSDIKTCDECNGSGFVKRTQRTPFGMFATTEPCQKCRGDGKMVTKPCEVCDGIGLVEKSVKISVDIPAGVDIGTRLRIAGEGEAGEKGGPHGDLYVRINVLHHKIFERRGTDLYTTVPVSFTQLVFGAEIHVPTINGKAKMKIPEGTQTNTVFKMKGKGLPHLRGYGTGDELVRVVVQTPGNLSKKQKDILKQYAKEGGDKVDESKGFFSKIMDAF
jgi:molecular chaperone DnaJ